MRKYLSILVLTIIIIPSVAFASWWNPFTWFNNWAFLHREDNTEILESRLAELEKN
ncbi:MAG: hypothetical protein WCW47_00735 [Candidatus Paceibacterota bacterium]|jgi:hypothetical protein